MIFQDHDIVAVAIGNGLFEINESIGGQLRPLAGYHDRYDELTVLRHFDELRQQGDTYIQQRRGTEIFRLVQP